MVACAGFCKMSLTFSLRLCAPFAVALWLNFSCLRSSLSMRQAHRLVGTPLPCLVGLLFFKICNRPMKLNNRTRKTGTLCYSLIVVIYTIEHNGTYWDPTQLKWKLEKRIPDSIVVFNLQSLGFFFAAPFR